MKARIPNPATIIPEAMTALQALAKVVSSVGVPAKTLALVHLRASQLNRCAFCIDLHVRQHGKSDTLDRQLAVSAWRESPLFSDAERAAFALCEAITHLGDDGVSDAVWDEAARNYDEKALGGLVLYISTTNLWNRLNVATRQVAGAAW